MDYRCSKCGHVVFRESSKKRIKSFCEQTGKTVYLKRISYKTTIEQLDEIHKAFDEVKQAIKEKLNILP